MNKFLKPVAGFAAVVAMAGLTVSASAEPKAVGKTNFELEAGGMLFEDYGVGSLGASLAIPTAEQFGLQFDAMGGDLDGDLTYGGGGQFYWRSKSRGAWGIGAGHQEIEDITGFSTAGLFGEFFYDWMTLGLGAGYIHFLEIERENFGTPAGVQLPAADEEHGVGTVMAGLRAYLGDYALVGVKAAGLFGAEEGQDGAIIGVDAEVGGYKFRPSLSAYVGAQYATEPGETVIRVGLKTQFSGVGRSLKMRDRQDRRYNIITGGGVMFGLGELAQNRIIRAKTPPPISQAECVTILQQLGVDALDPLLCPIAATLNAAGLDPVGGVIAEDPGAPPF